jgi:hypothetical protein
MKLGGPVRQSYSYSVPSPHRLFRTGLPGSISWRNRFLGYLTLQIRALFTDKIAVLTILLYVPLILKMPDVNFARKIGHFKGYFKGTKTFLNPKLSCSLRLFNSVRNTIPALPLLQNHYPPFHPPPPLSLPPAPFPRTILNFLVMLYKAERVTSVGTFPHHFRAATP